VVTTLEASLSRPGLEDELALLRRCAADWNAAWDAYDRLVPALEDPDTQAPSSEEGRKMREEVAHDIDALDWSADWEQGKIPRKE
jgi:hypothetical protein